MAGKAGRSGRRPGVKSLIHLGDASLALAKPAPPTQLTREAKREYKRVAKLLIGRQSWREDFTAPLAIYAQAWGDWVEARTIIAQEGLMVEEDGRIVPNQYLPIADKAAVRLVNIAGEMGLTLLGVARTVRKRSRERVVVEEGKAGVERETWEEAGLVE